MEISAIDNSSEYLGTVMQLWRKNSSTLGFFPEGAFKDYASKKNILVAINNNLCVGYLLYRSSQKQQITIQHLCIDDDHRGKGTAKLLVDHLKSISKSYYGIKVTCRRDFPASKVWPKLNFIAQYTIVGKSKDRLELTVWWYDNGHPNLLSTQPNELLDSKTLAVLDANIFFEICKEDGEDEPKALLADWLQPNLELCITKELFNEIDRSEDSNARKFFSEKAHSEFTRLDFKQTFYDEIFKNLRPLFPDNLSTSDSSDLKQISMTIASDIPVFVTHDSGLINNRDQISEKYDLHITSPAGLISKLDEILRYEEYKPARLAGTSLNIRLLKAEEALKYCHIFQNPNQGETKREFLNTLGKYMSKPDEYICLVGHDNENNPLFLLVLQQTEKREMNIPICRVAPTSLKSTLSRFLTFFCLRKAIEAKCNLTIISDEYLNETIIRSLSDDLFHKDGKSYFKIAAKAICKKSMVPSLVANISTTNISTSEVLHKISRKLAEYDYENDPNLSFDVETLLFPLIIEDSRIPSFIVPIDAHWAMELFDEKLAGQTLFGGDHKLALQKECVYFRSTKFDRGLQSPGRIFWYVTDDKEFHQTKRIRAYSQITEVTIGKPKELFRANKKYGIYKWKNIMETAKQNIDNDIMAIKFSNTILFDNPVTYEKVVSILKRNSLYSNFQRSPYPIPSTVFNEIYQHGFQLEK
jgi:predicted GNAT family acetyltransferase/predicted nucleic acid-binding protein